MLWLTCQKRWCSLGVNVAVEGPAGLVSWWGSLLLWSLSLLDPVWEKGLCLAPNFLCHIASGVVSLFLLNPWLTKKLKEWLECSFGPISVHYSSTIVCFAGTVLLFLCKTVEKLWHRVKNETDGTVTARKEGRLSDILILPNPEICIWV